MTDDVARLTLSRASRAAADAIDTDPCLAALITAAGLAFSELALGVPIPIAYVATNCVVTAVTLAEASSVLPICAASVLLGKRIRNAVVVKPPCRRVYA